MQYRLSQKQIERRSGKRLRKKFAFLPVAIGRINVWLEEYWVYEIQDVQIDMAGGPTIGWVLRDMYTKEEFKEKEDYLRLEVYGVHQY